MKALKLLLTILLFTLVFTSCRRDDDVVVEDYIALEEVLSSYDLWYIDYNSTEGSGNVPFLSQALTVSFINGNMYVNNNITGIGNTGNGYGISVGDYYTDNGILETEHVLDGYYNFNIVQISANEIRIDDRNQNVSYYLIGYDRAAFNYNALFYDNIEYFLQEYVVWERAELKDGVENIFDDERFLQFTSENNTTFYSSIDYSGTNIEDLQWDYIGRYTVYDVEGYTNLKGLTLNYDDGYTETFELTVLNEQTIQLYHQISESTYTFTGTGYIVLAKGTESTVTKNRKRSIIKRETVERKNLR